MPEGDTVFRVARRLDAALRGKVLTRTDVRVPSYATVDLTGRTIEEVVSRGKHLLMRVGATTIHSHLKMEGRWDVMAPGQRWRRPGFQARIVLEAAGVQVVGFALGILEVVPREREDAVVGHLGPDLLGPDWDPELAVANLRLQPERPLGEALLDQRNLAGIGNVYRSEIGFLRGLLPTRTVAQTPDLPGVVDLAARLLEANKDRSTRITTGRVRGDRLWVYGREARACLRCGTPVSRHQDPGLRDRVVYWCPSCQT